MSGAGADTVLRHGYTLDHLTRLARRTASRELFDHLTDPATRYEIAFAAMAEHLYSAARRPSPPELASAALDAIDAHRAAHRQFHGTAPGGGTRRNFERYWHHASAPAGSPEDHVTDTIALAQIWPRLTPASRGALTALAAHGDYQQAADALGITRACFKKRIITARRQFLALWHDGEAPSRPWLRDTRSRPGTDHHSTTYFLRARRRRAAAHVA